jgi:hypothetical protein
VKCLLWWTRAGTLDEKEYVNPQTLLRKFTALLEAKDVSVVMVEIHK